MSVNSPRIFMDFTNGEQEGKADKRNVKSSKIIKRLKALCCCMKDEAREGTVLEYNPDDYDYIIEKLVVKRVPLALFAIRTDLSDQRSSDIQTTTSGSASQSTSSFASSKRNPVIRETDSTRTIMDIAAYDRAANKALRSDRNVNEDSPGKSSNYRAKLLAQQEEILNKFSALHPDARESERLFKEPLNFPRDRQWLAEDISELASSTKSDVASKTASSVTVQDDVSTRSEYIRRGNLFSGFGSKKSDKSQTRKNNDSRQLRDMLPEKNWNRFAFGQNRKYVVSPFRMQKGSFDLKNVIKDVDVDGKSTYVEQSSEIKISEPTTVSKDRDISNTAVRWRVTIRHHQRANANSKSITSELHPPEKLMHR